MAVIVGQIRIVAKSKDEAEEIAGYLNRLSEGQVWFYRPKIGQSGEWLAYGEVEVPDGHDTRTWSGGKKAHETR